jgi:hypothetical protein
MTAIRLVFPPIEFGADEYALLQGRVVEFRMTQRMVTLGRSTPSCPVTFDLSLEGPAYKISRRQVSTSILDAHSHTYRDHNNSLCYS